MTANEYRQAIKELGMTQRRAAKALLIGERTSRRYAKEGLSEKASIRVRAQLAALKGEK